MGGFTEDMFIKMAPVIQNIYQLPFIKELGYGTLAKNKFIYYLQQDSLYLIDYAKALSLVAAKSRGEKNIALAIDFAVGALVAERSLHGHYFSLFGVTPGLVKAPACFAYTSHLLRCVAMESLAEGMAALLPCFWVYREVGQHVLANRGPQNPYDQWIDTYSGKEFIEATARAIAYTDSLAEEAGGEQRRLMEEAFAMSCRLEYYFWDDAGNLREWLV